MHAACAHFKEFKCRSVYQQWWLLTDSFMGVKPKDAFRARENVLNMFQNGAVAAPISIRFRQSFFQLSDSAKNLWFASPI
jgi:hypothetical protein